MLSSPVPQLFGKSQRGVRCRLPHLAQTVMDRPRQRHDAFLVAFAEDPQEPAPGCKTRERLRFHTDFAAAWRTTHGSPNAAFLYEGCDRALRRPPIETTPEEQKPMLRNRNEFREDKAFEQLTEAILKRDQACTTDLLHG